MDLDFTPRGVTKFIVKSAIALKAKQVATDMVVDYTRFEKDDYVTKIGSDIVGGYVAYKLKPVTDKVVDKTFDFVAAKKKKYDDKKNQNTEK
jgi:hypothetical protein